ncbi:MAG: NUDIX domain-containing protein [Gammaproteobacteria bacterium]|nr:NUDIX domain-containing protein [Gammaproteobacteria bacterium]
MTNPHLLSAGVVVVRWLDNTPHYLLLRAFNFWDFPKGLVEEGEDPFAAAQREVAEESGLTELDFRWGTLFRETPPYGPNKIARYYLAAAPRGEVYLPVSAELGKPEHDEFRWLDYAQAHSIVSVRVRVILDWAQALVKSQQT